MVVSLVRVSTTKQSGEEQPLRDAIASRKVTTTIAMKTRVLFWLAFILFLSLKCAKTHGFPLFHSNNKNVGVGTCRRMSAAEDTDDEIDNNGKDNDSSAVVPPTPCVRICRYSRDFYDGQVCIGCFREAFDIAQWVHLDNQERVYALEDALDRYDTENDAASCFEGAISREALQSQLRAYQARINE